MFVYEHRRSVIITPYADLAGAASVNVKNISLTQANYASQVLYFNHKSTKC